MGIDRFMELKENLFNKMKENESFEILRRVFEIEVLRYKAMSLDIIAGKRGGNYILHFPNTCSEVEIYKLKKYINKLINGF